jgi:hypothetical protein
VSGNNLKSEVGATSAFRGYRTQTLYIVKRVLSDLTGEMIYKPEGQEYLAICDTSGNLLEVVQIKNHIDYLTLSDFHPRDKDSFFRRSLQLYKDGSQPKLTIASFGEISNELHNAFVI